MYTTFSKVCLLRSESERGLSVMG